MAQPYSLYIIVFTFKTIERLLLGRKVVRFVIDSTLFYGQDFRWIIYILRLYKIASGKKTSKRDSVSCFTATAKPKVIEDIKRILMENYLLS